MMKKKERNGMNRKAIGYGANQPQRGAEWGRKRRREEEKGGEE